MFRRKRCASKARTVPVRLTGAAALAVATVLALGVGTPAPLAAAQTKDLKRHSDRFHEAHYDFLRRDFTAARTKFRQLLRDLPATSPFVPEIKGYLSEIEERPRQAQQERSPAGKAAGRANAQTIPPSRNAPIQERSVAPRFDRGMADTRPQDEQRVERYAAEVAPVQRAPVGNAASGNAAGDDKADYEMDLFRAHRDRTEPSRSIDFQAEAETRPARPARRRYQRASRLRDRYRRKATRRLNNRFRHAVGDRIFFNPGQSTLEQGERSIVRRQAAWVHDRPGVRVIIEAHADARDGADASLDIARRRADVIGDILIEAGLKATDIELDIQGNRNPIATCNGARADRACRIHNERVILRLIRADS